MAISYSNAAKAGRSQVVIDLVAGKTLAAATGAGSSGSLVIGTSALSGSTGVLVTLPLAVGWASNSSAGLITLLNTPLTATATASGTAALAQLRDNAGNVHGGTLTVGTSASDITINTTAITSGAQVQVTSGTITPAA